MTYSTIRYYPQDPKTMPAFTAKVKKEVFGEALQGGRIRTEDRRTLAQPGEHYEVDSFEFAQLNSHYLAHRTWQLAEQYLGNSISPVGEAPHLVVRPHSQPGRNAYYQNKPIPSVNHMYFKVPEEKKTVRTALSADVISHEVGHALLDGLRPDLVEEPDAEALALHEAFGDCVSMLLALSQPEVRGYLLYQTGGDLRKESMLSDWAEELGASVNRYQDGEALRSHLNGYRYRSAGELPPPSHGKDRGRLNNGPHSYSQVFSGAFFDILVSTYEKNLQSGMPCLEAMDEAQKKVGPLLLKGVKKLPEDGKALVGLAREMVKVDEEGGGGLRDILLSVFARRELLTVDMPEWSIDEFKEFSQSGRLVGQVKRTDVSAVEAEEMKSWIESHYDFLQKWDRNDGQRDQEVKNPSFWGAYGGDKSTGSTALWDHRDYVERVEFSKNDVTLLGFNRDGRGWYFHYDRENPEQSYREFRR